jgi:hypothetical protein
MPKQHWARLQDTTDYHGGSPPELDALGISHNQSSRWQSIARVPDRVFEATVCQYAVGGDTSQVPRRSAVRVVRSRSTVSVLECQRGKSL